MQQERLIARNVLELSSNFDKQMTVNEKTVGVLQEMHIWLRSLEDRMRKLEDRNGIYQPSAGTDPQT